LTGFLDAAVELAGDFFSCFIGGFATILAGTAVAVPALAPFEDAGTSAGMN
jgi:hypothetical protein